MVRPHFLVVGGPSDPSMDGAAIGGGRSPFDHGGKQWVRKLDRRAVEFDETGADRRLDLRVEPCRVVDDASQAGERGSGQGRQDEQHGLHLLRQPIQAAAEQDIEVVRDRQRFAGQPPLAGRDERRRQLEGVERVPSRYVVDSQ